MNAPNTSHKDCKLVWNILDMFRIIEASVDAIGSAGLQAIGEHAEHILRFGGFDFNDSRELRLHDYAEHLIRTGRWRDLAPYFDDAHDGGNSHWPMLDTYLSMLAAFEPIWRGRGRGRHLLSEDELRRVVEASR